MKSWEEMRDWAGRLLLSRTGADVQTWNRRVGGAGLAGEQALRSWLAGQGVTGYSQALLVWERFGYPDFMTAGADELIHGATRSVCARVHPPALTWSVRPG